MFKYHKEYYKEGLVACTYNLFSIDNITTKFLEYWTIWVLNEQFVSFSAIFK